MNKQSFAVIDFGMGNLSSVIGAFDYLGCRPVITSDPNYIIKADAIILPGVGSFYSAMNRLKSASLDEAIIEAVIGRGRKILGICLGMQLMGISSTEGGKTLGLGLIPAAVDKFSSDALGANKIPHIGFDLIYSDQEFRLLGGLRPPLDYYFVHSYRMLPEGLKGLKATCIYGEEFLAAYECENIFATQFHPEKSQSNGLVLLKNFINI